jgi:hypothetical protein
LYKCEGLAAEEKLPSPNFQLYVIVPDVDDVFVKSTLTGRPHEF